MSILLKILAYTVRGWFMSNQYNNLGTKNPRITTVVREFFDIDTSIGNER